MPAREWKYHGTFRDPLVERLVEQASAIVMGTMELVESHATEYSIGDAQIPVTWSLTVRFRPRRVLLGQCPDDVMIVGRSRPWHPDSTVEDRFWPAWLEDQSMEVILFLPEGDGELLHLEPTSGALEIRILGMLGERGTEGQTREGCS